MQLKTIYLLAKISLFLLFSITAWIYLSSMNQQINEQWAQKLTQRQVTFDKYRTLLPIIREVKIAKEMAKDQAIINMALDDQDPQKYKNGILALEKHRLKFHENTYFAAFVQSGNYYFNDAMNQYKDDQYRYTLSEKKKDDSWFFKAIKLQNDFQINVNKDTELGTVKVWINYLLKDKGETIGVIGTGLSLETFLKESVDIAQEGIRNIFVNEDLAIQLDRDMQNIDFSSLSKEYQEHKTLKLILDNETSNKAIKNAMQHLLSDTSLDVTSLEITIDGHKHVVGIAHLQEINWFSLTLIDVENLTLVDSSGLFVFFSIFFLLSMVLLQSLNNHFIFKPLEKFEKIIQEIKKGNYALEFEEFGMGMIKRVSHEFKTMLQVAGKSKVQLEQEVLDRTEKLEKANKAKSEFLANMSHEIRTPMTGMLGFVDRLEKTETDPQRLKQFKTIRNSGETLLAVINDILDFSKIESGKLDIEFAPIMLHEFFINTPEVFKQLASVKNISLLNAVNENLPKCVMGDETRLKQIMFNLISNAIKFTHDGGNITLQVRYKEEENLLYIAVIDTGIGISKDKLDVIFEAFGQEDISTTRKFGGTGLGLTISSRLVQLMGGALQVQSVVGEGSKFYFEIPMQICSDATIEELEKQIESNAIEDLSLQGHVLIVEDNKTNQMLLSMILDEYSITYDLADDGAEGVLKSKNNSYDLIFMDENMPIMNGIEATKIIRENETDVEVPIVAVTANALVGDREKFMKVGMNDYISKPYTEVDIIRVLKKYTV